MWDLKRSSKAILLGLVLTAGLALATVAYAQSRALDGPRASGIVGERYDGFAAIHGAATSDITTLVDSVNAERRAVYAQRAEAQKAPVSEVGKVYAAEILKQAPAGTWFLSESGTWSQKK